MAQLLTNTIRTGASLSKILWENWYYIILGIIIIPTIISSIQVAIVTQNPSYPSVLLGSKLINADNNNYNLINQLEQNPAKVIGMEKPTSGFWGRLTYYLLYAKNVVWEIISNLLFMFLPFSIILRIVSYKDVSKKAKNWSSSAMIYLSYVFIVNLLIIIYQLATKKIIITLPESQGIFGDILNIIIFTLPLKGLYFIIKHFVKILILAH